MYRQSEKNLLNSNISPTCPHNMVNFGPLAADICWRVWVTPANFNGFCILTTLLHGTLVGGHQPYCGVEHRAPPILGRAANTLGIGPHSSRRCCCVWKSLIQLWHAVYAQVLAEMDPDDILAKQVEQLEKEKRELQEKLKAQEKKVTCRLLCLFAVLVH